MKTRLLRGLFLVGACCACRVAGSDDPPAGDNDVPGAAAAEKGEGAGGVDDVGAPADTDPAACVSDMSGTLLRWQPVAVEGGGGGDDESSETELALDEDALEALAQVHGKIAVASISGPYRTGKSYFLNYVANQILARATDPPRDPGTFSFTRAFQTSPGIDSDGGSGGGDCFFQLLPACANPLPDQPGTALLLLDTPGLMAPRRPAVQEAQALALLGAVSSVVLYNVRATVGRPDITSLSMAVDAVSSLEVLSARLPLSAEDGEDGVTPSGEEGGEGLINRPSIVWLLQQSSLKMVDDHGEAQTAAAYVDAVLGDWGEGTVKGVFHSFFARTEAARLPFPLNEVDRLEGLDAVPYSDLSDAYKTGVSKAVDLIVPACAPKELGGQAMDGPALGSFLRKLTRVMNIPAIANGDDRPAAFLEGLEAKEVEIFMAACRADWEDFEKKYMPALTDELSAQHADCVERATRAANPRSAGEGGEKEGVQEGEDAASERSVVSRRPGFIETLTIAAEELYREYCGKNAWQWSDWEISETKKDLEKLFNKPAPGQLGDEGDGGGEEGTDSVDTGEEGGDPPAPLPAYDDVTAVFDARQKRWREIIAPDIEQSHPALAGLLFLAAAEGEEEKQDGTLTHSHVDALVSAVDAFLDANVDAARKRARAFFDDGMEGLRGDLKMLPPSAPLDDVETLSSRAKNLALEVTTKMVLVVGRVKADKVAAAEGWEVEAASAGEDWVRGARSAADGTEGKTAAQVEGGGGPSAGQGGDGKGGGDEKTNEDVGGGAAGGGGGAAAPAAAVDPAAAAEAEKAEAAAVEEAARVALSVLDEHHAPCLAKVTAADTKGRKAVARCAALVGEKWDAEESARPEELEGRKSTALEPAMKEREAEHVERAIQETFRKATDRYSKEVIDLELPTADEYIERLQADSRGHLARISSPKMEGGLLAGKEAQLELEKLVRELYEDFKSRNNKAWKSACEAAVDAYSHKVSRATSFFSLAPLRYSGAPPFEPTRCLTTGVAADKITKLHEKMRIVYQRGTWVRRWLVRLALWAGFVLATTAAALLAAGRQLQHRPMTIAFLAAAVFHLVVLLFSVSEGLALGTRPWLLASATVLVYVASGSTLGGKRGRRGTSRRPIWSGSRVMNGYANGSSSLMPLFKGHGGWGSGRGGGKGGSASWGGRHKE